MREPLLVGSSSSSIFLSLNPKLLPSSKQKPTSSSCSSSISSSKHFPAKLSCQSSPADSSTTADTTSLRFGGAGGYPILMNVRQDKTTPRRDNRLKYYADLASKLAEDGKFEDFLMIAETVLGLGIDSTLLVGALNVKLVSAGFSRLVCDGKVQTVVEVLSRVDKLGIRPYLLFDKSGRKTLILECRRLVNDGKLEEFVGLIETFAGFGFIVKDFVDPLDIVKLLVRENKANLAVRYSDVLPQAQILFTLTIQELGKKRDMESALIAYEASKSHGSNMYACRSIIDVCGLCGDSNKSRHIYEELLAQKVTPNIYVCNSLMNVNAHDVSYILHVYKHMQSLGVAADMTSYNILLKACCLAERVDLAKDMYTELRHKALTGDLKLDVITYSTIIKVFADARMWQVALKVKDDMLLAGVTPNEYTWSSLITACANVGLVEQAIQLFEEMLMAGCEPNTKCCNTLLNACVEARQYDRAFRFFQSWKEAGIPKPCHPNEITTPICLSDQHHLTFSEVVPFKPTISTYNILMKACGTDFRRAKALMDEMRIAGLSPDHISWSILIDIHGHSGDVRGAIRGLKSMHDAGIKPDPIAYTTAIKACVENKNLKIAFSLFDEMKKYQLQPSLVTYTTLLRARSKYGSLHEVQQGLAIYQDMRKAGYSSNDYFLKELIEEWCEGVIQGSNQNQGILALVRSRNKTVGDKSHNLVLEKVAAHLQKDITESLAIDIRGLTKVEARIVVLAVLRMIKESYAQGNSVIDDMIIDLGIGKGVSAANNEAEVQDSVVKLLRDELGLDVLQTGPSIPIARNDPGNPLKSDLIHESQEENSKFGLSVRRPAVLYRLKVTRNSLDNWLQRKSR